MLLNVIDLEKSYAGRRVVDGLSLNVANGEVVGLLGPNGAGKTTAFYMIMGLIRPDRGSVFFNNENITKLPVYKRAQKGMGYLAQEPSVFRNLTVEENILCVLERLKLGKKKQKERLDELLNELHLSTLAKKKGATLSGGERRRLEITRALVTNPKLLLLDEPFANIDPLAIAEVKTLIAHLSEKGIAVLITDHNARELCSIVDRSYLMRAGRVCLEGSVAKLLADKQARETYFGNDFTL